ncbi:SPOR domain-containing protein [Ruegeria faecimaris]|nr:SPOR domain-containing protein [Ruegeria faecimaris]
MDRATTTRAKPRALAVLVITVAALSGCDEALTSGGTSTEQADESVQDDGKLELFPKTTGNARDDVEAPDVFKVTEAGLWDGRPSLGGIWVAHPDVTQPERVRITNTKNNKSVTGALFRRERNLPGPALQLSSTAAAKLGILAGAPTRVEVVALRRKPAEKVEEKAPEPEGVAEPEETPTVEAVEPQEKKTDSQTTADVSEDVDKPAKRKWWQKKAPVAAAGAATAAAVAETAEKTDEAATEIIEAAPEPAPTANLTDPTVTPPTEAAPKRKWWQKKPADEITETPLDPIEGAAAAIEEAAPTPAATAASTEAASVSSLSKPFIQVGTFTVEENAEGAAEKIRRNGLPAKVQKLEANGKTVWRVIVGPALTRAERNAMQSDVKDLGFSDAYTVKN